MRQVRPRSLADRRAAVAGGGRAVSYRRGAKRQSSAAGRSTAFPGANRTDSGRMRIANDPAARAKHLAGYLSPVKLGATRAKLAPRRWFLPQFRAKLNIRGGCGGLAKLRQ